MPLKLGVYLRGELTKVHSAAFFGQTQVLIDILETSTEKNPGNDRNVTPLHLAAEKGFASICKYIIDRIEDKNPKDHQGRSPLHFAALGGHTNVCKLILNNTKSNVDKNPCSFENYVPTPLHFAASRGHLEICRLILRNVKDKNPKDSRGSIPLHHAAQWGHVEVFKFLLEKVGVKNIFKRDKSKRSPLQIARAIFPQKELRSIINRVQILLRKSKIDKRWKRGQQSGTKAIKAF